MKVAQAMRRQFATLRPSESVQAAAQALAEDDSHALLVLDESDRLVGLVTERDITVRAVAGARPAEKTSIGEIMSTGLLTCGPDDDAGILAEIMRARQIEQTPVLEGERLVGLLTLQDLEAEPTEREAPSPRA